MRFAQFWYLKNMYLQTYSPFLTQCAAVKTCLDVIKDPAHVKPTSSPFLYPNNTIHGYAPSIHYQKNSFELFRLYI